MDKDQGFIKFFGPSHSRSKRSRPVLDAVDDAGCHWACSYPLGKRPRGVRHGALVFMGWLVEEPNDILIYGRAVGMEREPGRDDATDAEVQRRPWKKKWPHYIRVRHAEFVAGKLSNGVSLDELMDVLKSDAFMSTQRNAANGEGNTNPRRAYTQQAAVKLSSQAIAWLNERLEAAFARHGKLPFAELKQLDWPAIPTSPHGGSR